MDLMKMNETQSEDTEQVISGTLLSLRTDREKEGKLVRNHRYLTCSSYTLDLVQIIIRGMKGLLFTSSSVKEQEEDPMKAERYN